jgi:hypothetical protein
MVVQQFFGVVTVVNLVFEPKIKTVDYIDNDDDIDDDDID